MTEHFYLGARPGYKWDIQDLKFNASVADRIQELSLCLMTVHLLAESDSFDWDKHGEHLKHGLARAHCMLGELERKIGKR